jgi:ABC-type sugar transport system ATPase subunit
MGGRLLAWATVESRASSGANGSVWRWPAPMHEPAFLLDEPLSNLDAKLSVGAEELERFTRASGRRRST